MTVGFSVLPQPEAPLSCPPQFGTQNVMCEELPVGQAVRTFSDVVKSQSVDGMVIMTVATFDFAEGALMWYHMMTQRGFRGLVVVSLDLGTYIYLTNRGVATVLMPTRNALNVCCLRRFRMAPWRATNDVKVRLNTVSVALLRLRILPRVSILTLY